MLNKTHVLLAASLALDVAADAVIPFFSNAMGVLGPYLAMLELANSGVVAPGPAVTYIDEHTGSTVGWSYIEILRRMTQILADFFLIKLDSTKTKKATSRNL